MAANPNEKALIPNNEQGNDVLSSSVISGGIAAASGAFAYYYFPAIAARLARKLSDKLGLGFATTELFGHQAYTLAQSSTVQVAVAGGITTTITSGVIPIATSGLTWVYSSLASSSAPLKQLNAWEKSEDINDGWEIIETPPYESGYEPGDLSDDNSRMIKVELLDDDGSTKELKRVDRAVLL